MRSRCNVRLAALVLACGLVAAAPAPAPALAPAPAPITLGDPGASWLGAISIEGGVPIPALLHLNMVSPPFVSGTLQMRPPKHPDCPSCLPCAPWIGLVTGKFEEGTYVLTVKVPSKDLLTCEPVCTSTIDVLLDFERDGSLHGAGYLDECIPGLPDATLTIRMAPVPRG